MEITIASSTSEPGRGGVNERSDHWMNKQTGQQLFRDNKASSPAAMVNTDARL